MTVYVQIEDGHLRLDVGPGAEDLAHHLRSIGPDLRDAVRTTASVFGTCEVEGLVVGPAAGADERILYEPAILQSRVDYIRQNYPAGVGPFRFVAGRARTCFFRTRRLPADQYCEGLGFAHLVDPDAVTLPDFDRTVVLCPAHAKFAVKLQANDRFDLAAVRAGHPPLPEPKPPSPSVAAGRLEELFDPALENKE